MAQSPTREYGTRSEQEGNAQGRENQGGKPLEAAAENVKAGVVGAIENATEKAKELAGNAGEFVGHAKEKVQEWAHSAKDKVKEAAHATGEMAVHAKEKVQEIASTAAHGAGEAIQTASEELTRVVRRYPVQSLLVGAAVGYLLGRATSRS